MPVFNQYPLSDDFQPEDTLLKWETATGAVKQVDGYQFARDIAELIPNVIFGPQGAQGSQGSQGSNGLTGPQGAQGVTGSQGVQGPQGSTGAHGSQGSVGAQGAQGTQGVDGLTGPQGSQGTQGTTGAQGTQGPQGFTGDQGLTGAQGTTGAQGVQGGLGPQGSQGNQGRQGSQGTQGTTGAQGTQGPQGIDGLTGPQGTQGVTGATGAQGVQGPQGVDGLTGPQGSQGTQGTTGSQGTQGPQGVDGLTGPQGAQGVAGPQGVQGSQGVQGQDGQSSSFYDYKVKTTITSGDPGSTYLIYNNATQTSATQINISHIDKDGYDIDIFLNLLKTGDTIIVQSAASSDDFQKWSISSTPTPQTGYVQFPVSIVSSGGVGTTGFSNNQDVIIVVYSIGPTGPQGSTGAQGVTGAQGFTGAQGATGSQGPQGTNGAQGSTGAQGPAGIAGPSTTINATNDTTTNSTFYPVIVAATGSDQTAKGSTTNLTFNPSTGTFSSTVLSDSKGEIRLLPQNSQSAAYPLVLSDAGKHILHPSADTSARTFTIPANGSVAYPIGTAITFVNQASAGVLTIAITTDTMRLAGAGTTGSRTLAANGIATALKITSTEWIISGTGLT